MIAKCGIKPVYCTSGHMCDSIVIGLRLKRVQSVRGPWSVFPWIDAPVVTGCDSSCSYLLGPSWWNPLLLLLRHHCPTDLTFLPFRHPRVTAEWFLCMFPHFCTLLQTFAHFCTRHLSHWHILICFVIFGYSLARFHLKWWRYQNTKKDKLMVLFPVWLEQDRAMCSASSRKMVR